MRKVLNKNKTVYLPEVGKMPHTIMVSVSCVSPRGMVISAGTAGPGAPALLRLWALTCSPLGKVRGSSACFPHREMVLIGFLTVCIYFKG